MQRGTYCSPIEPVLTRLPIVEVEDDWQAVVFVLVLVLDPISIIQRFGGRLRTTSRFFANDRRNGEESD